MKARSKPLETIAATDLLSESDLAPRLEILKVEEPPARKAGVKVQSVEELVAKLKDEAEVL